MKKDKENLNEKMEGIARRRNDLENYLGSLTKKLFVMLEGVFFDPTGLILSTRNMIIDSPFELCAEFCRDFEEETGRIEPSLDPSTLQ